MDCSSREDMFTIRTRKVMSNRLLGRKQMVVDIVHPGRPSIPVYVVKEKIAQMYKTVVDQVVGYGFRQHFGGGRSTGFALIYDSMDHVKKFEPKYRLDKNGIADHLRLRRTRRKVYRARNKRTSGVPTIGKLNDRKCEKPTPSYEKTRRPHAHPTRRTPNEQ